MSATHANGRPARPLLSAVRRVWDPFRPVAVTGAAAGALFAMLDASRPWTLACALLAVALLWLVIRRQAALLVARERGRA